MLRAAQAGMVMRWPWEASIAVLKQEVEVVAAVVLECLIETEWLFLRLEAAPAVVVES